MLLSFQLTWGRGGTGHVWIIILCSIPLSCLFSWTNSLGPKCPPWDKLFWDYYPGWNFPTWWYHESNLAVMHSLIILICYSVCGSFRFRQLVFPSLFENTGGNTCGYRVLLAVMDLPSILCLLKPNPYHEMSMVWWSTYGNRTLYLLWGIWNNAICLSRLFIGVFRIFVVYLTQCRARFSRLSGWDGISSVVMSLFSLVGVRQRIYWTYVTILSVSMIS